VFLIGAQALAAIDELELAGPYVRESIAVVALDGSASYVAHAYPVGEPARWRALVERGLADALAAYPAELGAAESPKDCCRRDPGHPPPHDVLDPLAATRR
jgi:hypothetical protein